MTKIKNYMVLIASSLINASAVGILINSAGVFFTPIADELGTGRGLISMTLTISNIACAIGGMFTVRWIRERTFKKMTLFCAVIYSITTFLLGFCHSVISMYALCVLRGFSAGVAGNVLVTILINNHYTKNNGLMTSIALGTSGLAAAVLSPLFTFLIASTGWRVTYMIAGVLAFVMYLPCILLPFKMNNRIVEVRQEDGLETRQMEEKENKNTTDRSSFLLVCTFGLLIVTATTISQHFPSMSIDAATGATMVSICMVFNTGGKIVMGLLTDKFGVEKPTTVYCITTLIGLAILATVPSSIAQMVAAALIGTDYSLGAVSVVMLSLKVFGQDYNKYYPTVSLIETISIAVFSSVVGFMYDIFHSYTPAVWMIFAFIAIGLVCVLLISKRTKEA